MGNKGQKITRQSKAKIEQRRNQVRSLLQKSMRSPTAIASQLKDAWPVHVIKNDIKFIMKGAWEWVDEQAMVGFVSDVKLAVEELQNIEMSLHEIIQDKDAKPSTKLRAIQTKINCVEARLNLQGKGPILMRLKKAATIIDQQRREGYKPKVHA